MRYPEDGHPHTRHFSAWACGTLAACVTLIPSEWEGRPALQLRGMAVAPEFRNRGVGTALLTAVHETVRAEGAYHVLWCNARLPAVGFYERAGWRAVSEPFQIPGIAIHRVMVYLIA